MISSSRNVFEGSREFRRLPRESVFETARFSRSRTSPAAFLTSCATTRKQGLAIAWRRHEAVLKTVSLPVFLGKLASSVTHTPEYAGPSRVVSTARRGTHLEIASLRGLRATLALLPIPSKPSGASPPGLSAHAGRLRPQTDMCPRRAKLRRHGKSAPEKFPHRFRGCRAQCSLPVLPGKLEISCAPMQVTQYGVPEVGPY